MLVKDLRQMLAEARRIGHARCVVLFTIERHTDTLSSGWFHGAVSPYDAVCDIHSMGQRWNHPIVCTDSSPTTKSDSIRDVQCARPVSAPARSFRRPRLAAAHREGDPGDSQTP